MACNTCRERKVKCDSARPSCTYCNIRGIHCQYCNSRKRQRTQQPTSTTRQETQQGWQEPDPLQGFPPDTQNHPLVTEGIAMKDPCHQALTDSSHIMPASTGSTHNQSELWTVNSHNINTPSVCFPASNRPQEAADDPLQSILWESPGPVFHDVGSSIIHADGNALYTGASSGLLALSAPLLSLAGKSIIGPGDYDFEQQIRLCQETLTKIDQSVQRLTELPSSFLIQPPTPLPADDIATGYINEYFNVSQIIFPIVRRATFERTRRIYRERPETVDLSWHMLQNAILAVGAFTSRSASTPASYRQAKAEGMVYFHHAWNPQVFLLPSQASLTSIQALCVMIMFNELIGNFELVYLCSSLACSLSRTIGLHKKTTINERPNSAGRDERERVFWILYFFDKMVSLDTGRPSSLDDTDITCSFPEPDENDGEDFSRTDIELLLSKVRLAQICSKVKTCLYSATALNRDIRELLPVRDALCRDLSIWRERVPEMYHATRYPFRISALPAEAKPTRALLLRVAYQYILGAIHRRFSSIFLKHVLTDPDARWSQKSSHEHLQAARELILCLDQIEMDVDAPNWFFAYHLLTAVVPILISMIANPLDESTKDDIRIVKVANGMFGRLEFITAGDFAFEGVGELGQQAIVVIDQAKRQLEMGINDVWKATNRADDGVEAFSALDLFKLDEMGIEANEPENVHSGDLFTSSILIDDYWFSP